MTFSKPPFSKISAVATVIMLSGLHLATHATSSEADIGMYLNLVKKKCARAYFPIRGYESNDAQVIFSVDRSGNTSNIKLKLRPTHVRSRKHSALADRALIYAVKNALPFDKPPPGWDEKYRILVTYSFPVSEKTRVEIETGKNPKNFAGKEFKIENKKRKKYSSISFSF